MTRRRNAIRTCSLLLGGGGCLLLVACASEAHSTRTAKQHVAPGAGSGDSTASTRPDSSAKSDPAPRNIPALKDVAIETLLTSPLQFNHQRIRVRGEVDLGMVTRQRTHPGKLATLGGPVCTLLFCTDGTNNCNSCATDVLLTNPTKVSWNDMPPIPLRGEQLGCHGHGSNLVCNPPRGATVDVVGTVEVLDNADPRNEISVFLKVEELR